MVPPGLEACGPSRQAFGLPQADAGETRARWLRRNSAPNAPDSLSPTASPSTSRSPCSVTPGRNTIALDRTEEPAPRRTWRRGTRREPDVVQAPLPERADDGIELGCRSGWPAERLHNRDPRRVIERGTMAR